MLRLYLTCLNATHLVLNLSANTDQLKIKSGDQKIKTDWGGGAGGEEGYYIFALYLLLGLHQTINNYLKLKR